MVRLYNGYNNNGVPAVIVRDDDSVEDVVVDEIERLIFSKKREEVTEPEDTVENQLTSFSGSDHDDDSDSGSNHDDDSDEDVVVDRIGRLIFPDKREEVTEPENTVEHRLTGLIYYKRIPKKNALYKEIWKIGNYGSWKCSVGYFMTLKCIPRIKGFHRADRFNNKDLFEDSGYRSHDY
jgi:hypothetical protein